MQFYVDEGVVYRSRVTGRDAPLDRWTGVGWAAAGTVGDVEFIRRVTPDVAIAEIVGAGETSLLDATRAVRGG